jgi:predicted Ser/Thr protein kinase
MNEQAATLKVLQAVDVTGREVSVRVIRELKRAQCPFSPDVYLVDLGGDRLAVLKDYSGRGIFGRRWGALVLAREARALAALADVEGIPRLLARIGRTGVIEEFCPGTPLPRRGVHHHVAPEFFDRARELLREMHQRGVAHGDVRRKNILVSETGQPLFIDFQTAWFASRSFLRRRLFGFVCRLDEWNLLKIKAASFPRSLSSEENEVLAAPPPLLRAGRFLRHVVYRKLRYRNSNT